jgi:hypothetical protein
LPFFHIVHIFSLLILPFFRIFHISSLFNLLFSIISIWFHNWYGKYGREASLIGKRYRKYRRKVRWRVKRYENFSRKVSMFSLFNLISSVWSISFYNSTCLSSYCPYLITIKIAFRKK